MQESKTQNRKSKMGVVVVLALILLLGLALRVHRMAAESVDFEEFVNIGPLDLPSLPAYLHQVRLNDPSTAPLPFAAMYLWTRAVGNTVARARGMFVVIGMLNLALLFLIAYEIFGRNAFARRVALIATLCAALSPVHIYFSQEARFYAPLTFLALASFYCLFRALNEDRKLWWRLNIFFNMLIPWTHLMGWAVLFAQGVCLLILRFHEIKRIFKWGLIQCLSLVPLVFWMMSIHVQSFKSHYSFIPAATLTNIVGEFFGDDILSMAAGFEPTGTTWWFLPQSLAAPIVAVRTWLDPVLPILAFAAFAWFVYRILGEKGKGRKGEKEDSTRIGSIFLLVWFIVPPAILHIVSRLWIPCAFPRYSTYHTLALYIIIGYAVARLSRPWLRGVGVAAVGLLLLYQDSLVLPGPIRTDWKGAGQMIKTQGAPDDVILTYGALYLPMLLFNMGQVSNPSAAGQNYPGLPDLIDYTFHEFARSPNPRDHARTVWCYLLLENDPHILEQGLQDRGYIFDDADFAGARKMRLYHIKRNEPLALAPQEGPMLALDTFTKGFAEQVRSPEVKAFRVAISWDSDESGAFYARLAMSFAEKGGLDLASSVFRKAVVTNPAWAAQLSDLLVRALGGGIPSSAASTIETLVKAHPNDAQLWALYGNALMTALEYDGAVAALDKSIALDPRNMMPYLGKWRAMIGKDNDIAAAAALRAVIDSDVDLAAALKPLYTALYEAHSLEQAQKEFKVFRAAGMPVAPELKKTIEP